MSDYYPGGLTPNETRELNGQQPICANCGHDADEHGSICNVTGCICGDFLEEEDGPDDEDDDD